DDRDVPPFDEALVAQAGGERGQAWGRRFRRRGMQETHFAPRLLGARAERRGQCGDQQRPPFHSITSSATARIAGGNTIPSCLAVRWLTTSSNLVGCSTGSSAGFAPF